MFYLSVSHVVLIVVTQWQRNICSVAEYMINPYQWQKDIDGNYPKLWLSYTEAIATKLCWSTQWSGSLYQSFCYLCKNSEIKYFMRKEQHSGAHQTNLLVNITKLNEVPSKQQMNFMHYAHTGSLLITLRLFWRFQMATGISHKVTLMHVKLLHDFVLCNYNFTCETKISTLAFCGLYSNLDVYSGMPDIYYTLNYFPTPTFAFSIFLDVISSGILYTSAFTWYFHQPVWKLDTQVVFVKKEAYVYKVEVEKYLIVYFFIHQTRDMTLTFHRGPGRLSSSETVYLENLLYRCHTFVCFASVTMHRNESDNFKMSFYGSEAPYKKQTGGSKMFPWKISLPNQKNDFIILKLFCIANDSSVKASVKQFGMKAPADHGCKYGGISFYDNHSSESEIICTVKNNYFSTIRNVYSTGHQVVIVAYAHENYAVLNATVEISWSNCHVIKINLCPLRNSPIHTKLLHKLQTQQGVSLQAVIQGLIPSHSQKLALNKCSIMQFFWKVINKCHEIPVFRHFKQLSGFLSHFEFYSFWKSIELRMFQLFVFFDPFDELANYQYKLEGILSGDPQNFGKRHWFSKLLLQLGNEMIYDSSKDFTVTIWQNNKKKACDDYVWRDSNKCVLLSQNPKFFPELCLVPNKTSDLFFTVNLREHAFQSSLALKLEITDTFNWLDLLIFTSSTQRKNMSEIGAFSSERVRDINVEQYVNAVLKLVSRKMVNLAKSKLQFNISSKVSYIYLDKLMVPFW